MPSLAFCGLAELSLCAPIGAGSAAAASAAAAALTSTPIASGRSESGGTPIKAKTKSATPVDKGEREVLSDFFNSLITKTPPPKTPTKK